jgi:hypothetical protein
MTAQLEELKDDLLTLPLDVRASLAKALIASLDETVDADAESLWMAEVKRRDVDIRSGKAVLKFDIYCTAFLTL